MERWEHRRLLQLGRSLSIPDNRESLTDEIQVTADRICCSTQPDGRDRWIWLNLEPSEFIWRDFIWRFKVQRNSDFRELQFGFRYRDFFNRYRFRYENCKLFFDKVANGKFVNGIRQHNFTMEIGRVYEFSIRCQGSYFSLEVDGATLLQCVDPANLFPEGSIAVILWEDDGVTPISSQISEIRVTELGRI